MERINKIILWMVGIILVLLAILSAVIVYKPENKKEAEEKIETKVGEVILDECTNEYEALEEDVEETNTEEEKISPNCEMVLTKHYKECNDFINEYITAPKDIVNYTKEEVQNKYKDWEIKEFSSSKINLYKEFEGSCGEHYILRDNEGKIMIYKIDDNNKETLYEKTDISTDYLPEKDKNAIKQGQRINGKEKLNELIESFE